MKSLTHLTLYSQDPNVSSPELRLHRSALIGSLKKTVPLACAAYIVSDLINRTRYALGHVETRSGAVHSDREVDASIEYIENVFASYKQMTGLERFSGRVAEVGPGDNCGVALLFRQDGCSHVDMVDRFFSLRDADQQSRIYRALFQRHPQLATIVGQPARFVEGEYSGVVRHTGKTAAAERFFANHTGYDHIVSCAVLEHVYDPLGALRDMASALHIGGSMLHAVDLRDHGMFSEQHDDTKFREIPEPVYQLMTRGSGRPNRVPYSAYRQLCSNLPLATEFYVGSLFGETAMSPYVPYEAIEEARRIAACDLIEQRQDRFAQSFRNLPTQDLSVSSFFLVARRIR